MQKSHTVPSHSKTDYNWEGRYYRLAQTVAEIALNEDWDRLTEKDSCYAAKKRATDIIRERNRELYEEWKKHNA